MTVKQKKKRTKRTTNFDAQATVKETDWKTIRIQLLQKAIQKRLMMNNNVSQLS